MSPYYIVDAHCDTLSRAWKLGLDLLQLPSPAQCDLRRLQEGGVKLQFFAAFVKSRNYAPCLHPYLQQIEFFLQQVEKHHQWMHLVRSRTDLDQAQQTGQLAAVLSIEGGEALEGDLTMLQLFYRLGVRALGLTWNNRNALADGIREKNSQGGLTDFGISVVKEMNQLGMIIDVSHLAEAGFWDVLEISQEPVIASHSNCRDLHNHPRNLSDTQLKGLAQKGGIVGITLVNEFLGSASPGMEQVLDHLEHAVAVMGEDYVGLGTDFDGVENPVLGIEEATQWPRLIEAMHKRGFTESMVHKILGKNYLRLLKQILK
ncbi:MAG: membrane dipeptidase [Syntrophomonadaceae bacterium]|nr:membrane dipeptidase [Syntrophomonadaceae bacterium]